MFRFSITCRKSILHIFLFFNKAVLFVMIFIIRMIIPCNHCSHIVKAFNQNTYFIQIRKTYRTLHKIQVIFFTNFGYLVQQCLWNFIVINKIKPSKAHFTVLLFINLNPINNGGNSADQFIFFVGQKKPGFRTIKVWIFFFVKCFEFVGNKWWNPIRRFFIKGKREFYKFF